MQIHGKDYIKIMERAELEKSMRCLVPYRNALTFWAKRHPEDILRIAAIGSHRLDHHLFCTTDGHNGSPFDQTKCNTIDKFIKDCESEAKTVQIPLT